MDCFRLGYDSNIKLRGHRHDDFDRSLLCTFAFCRNDFADVLGHQRNGSEFQSNSGMAVLAEWRGSEVAKVLLEQAESELRDLHCTAITLDTTRPLQRAIHFYEKHGFHATGEVNSFFGMELFAYRKKI